MKLKIDPRQLPAEGLQLQGTLPISFFGLSQTDHAKALTPLHYDLLAVRDDNDELLVTGTLSATFELECGRCTEKYEQKVELEDYATSLPIENDAPVDLTEPIREDILLALPTYPRCETGNVQQRECPAEGRFDAAPIEASNEQQEDGDASMWEALDQLQNLKRN